MICVFSLFLVDLIAPELSLFGNTYIWYKYTEYQLFWPIQFCQATCSWTSQGMVDYNGEALGMRDSLRVKAKVTY